MSEETGLNGIWEDLSDNLIVSVETLLRISSYIGISAVTVVPLPGSDSILKLPSNSRIRSCIPISPSLPARDRSSKLSGR